MRPYFIALLSGLVGELWGKFGRCGGHSNSLGGFGAKLWGPPGGARVAPLILAPLGELR